jgi:hypothetical protein
MLTIISQEKANEFWEHIWTQDEVFDDNFVEQIPLLLSLLVSRIVNEEQADIGIADGNGMVVENMINFGPSPIIGLASCLTYDEYSKNRLELYYGKDGKFTIYLYLDFPDEKEYTHVLTPKLVKLIPDGLVNQMKVALKRKDTVIVKANMLE